MRVDIESGKYTYIFEDGRARLLRYGDPTSRDVVGDKLIYCMAAEISELRQQLAAKQAEVDALMLEYCPGEMSQEQLEEWCRNQLPTKEN